MHNTNIKESVNKKKRNINLSFLPVEILNALMSGDSIRDSDDEGDSLRKTELPSTASSNESCKLLSLLPPVGAANKAQQNYSMKVDSSKSVASSINSNSINETKSKFNFQYTTVTNEPEKNNKDFHSNGNITSTTPQISTKPNTVKPFKIEPSFLNNPLYEMEVMMIKILSLRSFI